MPAPKADAPLCDVHGCGLPATSCSDGTEVDIQGLNRPAIPNLNTCGRHKNWPHSTDAEAFAATPKYKQRV